MRLLYLDWPHLPLRLELARHPSAAELIVLGEASTGASSDLVGESEPGP